jgi:diketogulonate reductase-like aldo/keto reductase
MTNPTASAREISLHNGVKMPTLAFGLMQDPVLMRIAEHHRRTTGQIVLRWHVQSGRTALPKTSRAARMVENRDIYDFALSDEEMRSIDQLGTGPARRSCPDPSTIA